jgi:hypothetical protein
LKLTFNIGARARPEKLLKTVEASLATAVRPDTTFLICLDDDDESMRPILDRFPKDPRILISVKPREDSRGEKYDRCFTEAPADVYLLGVDHSQLLTKGWDQIILDAAALFPDGIGVINGPMNNMSFPKLQAITHKLATMIGHTYNWDYPFWFIDHELDDIARMIGRYVFVDIEIDTTTLRAGNRTQRMRDLKFWTSYFYTFNTYRRELANRIINSPEFIAPDWEKKMLSTWHHPVEARSNFINQEVYNDAENLERDHGANGEPPDPGYIRLMKAAAEKAVAEHKRLESAALAA